MRNVAQIMTHRLSRFHFDVQLLYELFRKTRISSSQEPVSYTHLDVYKRQLRKPPYSRTTAKNWPCDNFIYLILYLNAFKWI